MPNNKIDLQQTAAIKNNMLSNQLDAEQSINFFNNKDDFPLPYNVYAQDSSLYTEDSKIVDNKKLEKDFETSKAVAALASKEQTYPLLKTYRDTALEQEKVIAKSNEQVDFENSNFFSRVYGNTVRDLKSRALARLYSQRDDLRKSGKSTAAIDGQIKTAREELNNMVADRDMTVASGLGSFAASIWDMVGFLIGDVALTAALSASGFGTVGGVSRAFSLARNLARGGYVFKTSKDVERGNMLMELEDVGVDPDTASRAADLYGNVSAAIETLGFTAGGKLVYDRVQKGIVDLIKRGGKEALSDMAVKTSTKEGTRQFLFGLLKDTTASSLSEGAEEVLQGEASEAVKREIMTGDINNDIATYSRVFSEAYKTTADSIINVAKSVVFDEKLSDADEEKLDLFLNTFAGSFIGGGVLGGVGGGLSYAANSSSASNQQNKMIKNLLDGRNNRDKSVKFKEFMAKSELDQKSVAAGNEVTRTILEANGLDTKIRVSQESLYNLLQESQKDEELAAFIAPFNLQEKVANTVDGMVDIDIDTAKALIFAPEAEKVFNMLVDDIAWTDDSLTPNQAIEAVSSAASDTLSITEQDAVNALADKLYDRNLAKEKTNKRARDFANAEANVALQIARTLADNDAEHDTMFYLNQITENLNITRPEKKTKIRQKKPASLLQFLKQNGGVVDEGGELRSRDAQKQYIGLVNKNGLSLDYAGEAAWEAGYFIERPTISELLDAIDEELRVNKKYPLDYVEEEGISDYRGEAEDYILDNSNITQEDLSKLTDDEINRLVVDIKKDKEVGDFVDEMADMESVDDFGDAWDKMFQVVGDTKLYQIVGDNLKIRSIDVFNEYRDKQSDKDFFTPDVLQDIKDWLKDGRVVLKSGRVANLGWGARSTLNNILEQYDPETKRTSEEKYNGELAKFNREISNAENSYFGEKSIAYESVPDFETYKLGNDFNLIYDVPYVKKEIEKVLSKIGEKIYQSKGKSSKGKSTSSYWKIENSNGETSVLRLSDHYLPENKTKSNEFGIREGYWDNEIVLDDRTISSLLERVKTKEDLIKYINNYLFGETYYQNPWGGQTAAGYFDTQTLEINLTSARNPVTFTHELFHYFMFNMTNIYNNGTMREDWAKSFEKAMKWAGAEKVDGKYQFARDSQEKITEAFTSYLLKGQAPNKEVSKIFDVISKVFMYVYSKLRFKKARLNKNVTTFFDKIFVLNGDIETQLRAEKVGLNEKPDNVTNEEWQEYLSLKERSRGEALGKATEAMVEETKLKSETAYKEKYDEAYNAKMQELDAMPEYMALDVATTRKFSRQSVEETVGVDKLDKRFIATDKEIMNEDSTVVGDDIRNVAKAYGFDSVSAFVDFLNDAKSKKEVSAMYAEERADAWLRETYPELNEIEAQNAVRTVSLIKTLVMEYMMSMGIPLKQFNMYYNEMQRAANRVIANSKMTDIANTDKWYKRLVNLLDRVNISLARGDNKQTAKLKWRAAFLNYTIMQSKTVSKISRRFNKHFTKYRTNPTPQQLKKIEGKVWDIISDVLRRFKYSNRKPTDESVFTRVEDYVNSHLSEQYSGIADLLDDLLFLQNDSNLRVKDLSVSDFLKLDRDLRLIESVSKLSKMINLQGYHLTIDEAVNNIINNVKEKGITPWTTKDKTALKDFLVDFCGVPETVLSQIFPKDVFVDYILDFQDGNAKAERWRTDVSKRLADLLKPAMKYGNREVEVDGRYYTVLELMVYMLNAGNEHNMDCIIKTIQNTKDLPEFSKDDFMNLIQNAQSSIERTGITGFDIRDIAQGVWDIFEEYVPAMKEAQERLDGRQIHLVKPDPLSFNDGKQLRGGYYPARKVDYSTMPQNAHNISGFVQKTFFMTLDRGDTIHQVPTDLRLLSSWVGQMGRLLFVSEEANNIEKIANHPDFVREVGDQATQFIMDWLNMSLLPDRISPWLSYFGSVSSTAALGNKFLSFFVQFSGLISAVPIVGLINMSRALSKFVTGIGAISMYRKAFESSTYMKNRYSTPENHLMGVDKFDEFLTSKFTRTQRKISNLLMLALSYGDMAASLIVWDAAYNNAIRNGESETNAVKIADSAVRTTQSDTADSARPKALKGMLKLLSPFMSFFAAANSLITSRWYFGGQYGKLNAAMAFVTLAIFAPTIEAIVRSPFEYWGTTDDEKRKLRRKGIVDITTYMQNKVISNIPETSLAVLFPYFGVGRGILQYAREGREATAEVMPLVAINKIVNTPVAFFKYATAETDKERDKYGRDSLESLGYAMGGINLQSLERNFRFLTELIGGK